MPYKQPLTTSIGYKIIKKGSNSNSDSSSDSISSDYSSNSIVSVPQSTYKIPKGGTKQDNMTKEEILEKLKGYKPLKNMQDKQYLLTLTPFKVWIRYFNTDTKEFRLGGLLKLVDPELRYIMLVNTTKNLTWSVQLKNNIIFVPRNIENKKQKLQEIKELQDKEQLTKEKLYKLYKQGKLIKR